MTKAEQTAVLKQAFLAGVRAVGGVGADKGADIQQRAESWAAIHASTRRLTELAAS